MPSNTSDSQKEYVTGFRHGNCQRNFLPTSAICQQFSPMPSSIAPATPALIFQRRWHLLDTASGAARAKLAACTNSASWNGQISGAGDTVHGSTNSFVTTDVPWCLQCVAVCLLKLISRMQYYLLQILENVMLRRWATTMWNSSHPIVIVPSPYMHCEPKLYPQPSPCISCIFSIPLSHTSIVHTLAHTNISCMPAHMYHKPACAHTTLTFC